MGFQRKYDAKKKTHVLTLSSLSKGELHFGDKRRLSLKQNKIIEAIQFKIDIGRKFKKKGSSQYQNMVSAISWYNLIWTKNNLKNVDWALEQIDKNSSLLDHNEITDKSDVEAKMPNERKARFGEESNMNFEKMCQKANVLSSEAHSKVDNQNFFNNYFNPKHKEDLVNETYRRKVKEVYKKIEDHLVVVANPMFTNDYSKRCFVYAFVYPVDTTHNIHLSSQYQIAKENGENSKPGVIIHEMSHFNDIGNTKDHAYGAKAQELDVTKAIENADTYEYAAENAW